jgi:hypothetical protein
VAVWAVPTAAPAATHQREDENEDTDPEQRDQEEEPTKARPYPVSADTGGSGCDGK